MTGNKENSFRTLGVRQADALFLIACFVFLYLHLFLFPLTPIFYEGDHVALLNDAKRILEGEVLYRDFFEFTFPGGSVLYFLAMTLVGAKYWISSFFILSHGMAAAVLGLYIGRQVIGGNWYAYLPSSLYIFFGFRWYGIDGEHRMFSPLFVLLAIAILLRSRSYSRIALAGISCSFASYFTQQRGLVAVAAIGLFLLIEIAIKNGEWLRFVRSASILCLSFGGALLILLAPSIASAGPDVFFQSTIVFLVNYIEDPTTNSLQTYLGTLRKISDFGVLMTAVAAFYYLLVPLVYLAGLAVLVIRRKASEFADVAGPMLLCITGLFLAIGTPGPNAGRLFQISMPALIVFAYLLFRASFGRQIVPLAAVVVLALFGIALGLRLQTAWDAVVLQTPSGNIAFLSPVIRERYEWMLAHTSPGDYVFETYNSHVNFPLHVKNPSKLSILLNSGYSPPEHVKQAIGDLQRTEARYIIWDGTWTKEMAADPKNDRIEPLYLYLTANYRLVHSFTPYDGRERQVWEKLGHERK